MKTPAPTWVTEYLRSDDPALQKRGLQEICDRLEDRFPLDLTGDPFVRAAIPRLKSSQDTFVRRWLYKLAGLLAGTPAWATWLKSQVSGGETDPENVSWAVAALGAHTAHSELRKAIEGGEHEYAGTALELAPRYFEHRSGPLDLSVVDRVMNDDDDLQHRWLTLLHGKDARLVARDVIVALNRHPSPLVAEYSIWSIYRDPAGRLFDLDIRQSELPDLPGNVRRWYYRLFTKHSENLAWPNGDVIEFATRVDPDPQAREGFALGLTDYSGPQLAKDLVDWYEREDGTLVRRALLRHFVRFQEAHPLYKAIAHADAKLEGRHGNARQTRANKASVHRAKPRTAMDPITIVNEQDAQAFVLAVDAVGFSLLYDVDQVRVFRDLLAELSNAPAVRSATPDTFVHLLTGDGFILAFLGVDQRFDPIRLALELQRATAHLRQYKLRFGAHAGAARLLALSDGTKQLISNAINWAARVMSVAEGNQVLISEPYYNTYIRNPLNEFPGCDLRQVPDGITKHGEPVPAFELVVR